MNKTFNQSLQDLSIALRGLVDAVYYALYIPNLANWIQNRVGK